MPQGSYFPCIRRLGATMHARSQMAAIRSSPISRNDEMTNIPADAVSRHPTGFAARWAAAILLEGVLRRNRPLDEQVEDGYAKPGLRELSERDRALARRIVATVLRRLGTLRRLIDDFLDQGLPKNAPQVETALLIGAAQLLFLRIPQHAAVDLSVRLVQGDRRHSRYAGLVNAVMRRIANAGTERLAGLEPLYLDTPDWLFNRWVNTYGGDVARAIAHAHSLEPSLDITVKSDPDQWAERLGGRKLPTGSVRLAAPGPISALPGYAEGNWWVQDAAAALPARLFGDLRGRKVADLCAAPGGKTAQLALAGAEVTALDRSEARLARLRDNLVRLGLEAQTVLADALEWSAGTFDGVLVDAPCLSTGAIRRHPDVPWLKRESDLAALTLLQRRLLDKAASLLKPGGTLIYCTCSLEPEENESEIAALLAREPRLRRRPLSVDEVSGFSDFVSPAGDLRTLPCYLPDADPAGLDGFFAARLERF